MTAIGPCGFLSSSFMLCYVMLCYEHFSQSYDLCGTQIESVLSVKDLGVT